MIPPGARIRRWLFERVCIVNTVLFAGFGGYQSKLWMVEPATSDYAGLYSWAWPSEAERYGQYITSVLAPFSVRGTLGCQILPDVKLNEYLKPTKLQLTRHRPRPRPGARAWLSLPTSH